MANLGERHVGDGRQFHSRVELEPVEDVAEVGGPRRAFISCAADFLCSIIGIPAIGAAAAAGSRSSRPGTMRNLAGRMLRLPTQPLAGAQQRLVDRMAFEPLTACESLPS